MPVAFVLERGQFWIILLSLAGFVAAFILIANSGTSFRAVVSNPFSMIEIGQGYANLRYGYGEGSPFIVTILNVFLYLACMLGGVWLATADTFRKRLLGALPLLAGMLQAVLVSARTGFIWMCVVLAASYLASVILFKRAVRIPTAKSLFFVGAVGMTMLSVFVFLIQVTRHDLLYDPWSVMFTVRVGLFGSPVAFSQWLRANWDIVTPQWGVKTFGGLADLLGIATRGQGLGWEGISVAGFQGETPNVYTAFRQLIEDFTVPGTIAVFFCLGMLTGAAYRRVSEGRIAWVPVLALFYGVTLGSYLANWLTYNTILFAWLLFFVFFIILSVRRTALSREKYPRRANRLMS